MYSERKYPQDTIVPLIKFFGFWVFVLVIYPAAAFGPFPKDTTIHVDSANTSNIEDGSAANPFNTISEGIAVARAGDVVGAAPGTYAGGIVMKDRVTLLGSGADLTTIDAGNISGGVRCGSNATLSGFRIVHASGLNEFAVECTNVSNAVLQDIVVVDNQTRSIGLLRSSATLRNSLIIGNPDFTSFCPCNAITISQSAPWIINNTIEASDPNGNTDAIVINYFDPSMTESFTIDANRITGRIWLGDLDSTAPLNNLIKNNIILAGNTFSSTINSSSDNTTIINNTLIGGGGILLQGSSSPAIINNIIAFGVSGIDLFGAPAPEFLNNDVFSNIDNYVGWTNQTDINGNISLDPKFVDFANETFHPARNSPAIDAGLNMDGPDTDFEGRPRPLDGNSDGLAIVDMGAYENPKPETHNVIVITKGSGTGTVISDPLGIDCGVDCTEDYIEGADITLTAIPGIGSMFDSWGGDCATFGSNPTCQISIDATHNVVARFQVTVSTPIPLFSWWALAILSVLFGMVGSGRGQR